MYKMIEFIKSEVLVIILTISSLTCTGQPMRLMLVASLLMMLFCVRSLMDADEKVITSKIMWCVLLVLSIVYCILSRTMVSCIIFCELSIGKLKWGNAIVPMMAYVLVMPFVNKLSLARHLLNCIILFVVSVALHGVCQGVKKYIVDKSEASRMVKVAAVRELYERKLNKELMVKNYLADKNARLEERENISRNIHNSVGHSIMAAIMTLDAADMLYDTNPDLAREKMHIASDRIKGGLESIRHAVRVLDKEVESISCDDFEKTLEAVAEEFAMDTSIKIRTAFTRMSKDVEIAHEHVEFLTGALQELLTNGVKHGNASVFDVQVLSDSGHIRMSVADNGKSGIDDNSKDVRIKNGFGLKKIDSYVKRCGGETAVFAQGGFKYEITLPLLKEDNYE